jgi:flagellar basal-body rod protein FlgG
MSSITALTLTALQADQTRMERVASNIANVTTPGYKREIVVERGAAAAFAQLVDGVGDADAIGMNTAEVARDDRPGTLKPTGAPLDIALAGPGYLELSTEHGPVYTRAGAFHLDASGRLVNSAGHAVMGSGGEVSLASDRVAIDSSGRITENGRDVAQLRVVDWSEGRLTPLGSGLFAGTGSARELDSSRIKVHQGHLENANVETAHEMVELMATVRHFESLLRAAQGRDELLGTAIRRLGDL